jgi:hypothetical protein
VGWGGGRCRVGVEDGARGLRRPRGREALWNSWGRKPPQGMRQPNMRGRAARCARRGSGAVQKGPAPSYCPPGPALPSRLSRSLSAAAARPPSPAPPRPPASPGTANSAASVGALLAICCSSSQRLMQRSMSSHLVWGLGFCWGWAAGLAGGWEQAGWAPGPSVRCGARGGAPRGREAARGRARAPVLEPVADGDGDAQQRPEGGRVLGLHAGGGVQAGEVAQPRHENVAQARDAQRRREAGGRGEAGQADGQQPGAGGGRGARRRWAAREVARRALKARPAWPPAARGPRATAPRLSAHTPPAPDNNSRLPCPPTPP